MSSVWKYWIYVFVSLVLAGSIFMSCVSEEDYMEVEAADFFHRYEGQSFGNLVKSLFSANRLTDSDMEEIRGLLHRKED